jgi:hypothetical protein
MSFTSATQRTHHALVRALAGKSGQTLTTGEIRQLVEELAPEIGADIQWLHPTDHCDNHTVQGACPCSKTEDAPLSRVSHGVFRVC